MDEGAAPIRLAQSSKEAAQNSNAVLTAWYI